MPLITTLLLLASLAVSAEPAASVADALRAAANRVASDVQRLMPEAQRSSPAARVERSLAAIDAGRLYLALYEIEGPWEMTSAFRFSRDAGHVTDVETFTRTWKDVGAPRGRRRAGAAVPLVIEALAAAAEARGPATYHASLPFARDADIGAGLYYLGESQAVGAFATFAESLPWASAGTRPALRSIAPELDALDAEVTAAYGRMVPAQHSLYVLTSVTLKRARTLNDRGQFAGALLEYLLARHRFALLRDSLPALADEAFARELAAARAAVRAVDDSIAQLFIEMAEAGRASTDDTLRRGASFILSDVLPSYRRLTTSADGSKALTAAAKPATTVSASPVTVTLVRWPFT